MGAREQFEKWIRSYAVVSLDRDDDKENYFDDNVQLAWVAWKTAYELGSKAGKTRAFFARKQAKKPKRLSITFAPRKGR